MQTLGNRKNRDLLFVYGVLAWPILHFLVFWVGMNSGMVYNSFFVETLGGNMRFVGFDNYIDVIKSLTGISSSGIVNPYAIKNVVSLWGLALLINMPITILFSFAIFRKIRWHKLYRVTLFIPAIISVVVLTLSYRLALDYPFGIVNQLFDKLGLAGDGFSDFGIIPMSGWFGDERTVWPVILVFSVWTGVSGNLIYFSSAMGRLPDSVIESARIDGASELRMFRSIVIPMIWPVITTISITLVSGAIAWFMPSLLLTDGASPRASTLALIITTMTKNGTSGGFVPALGVLIAIIGAVIILTFKYVMERFNKEVEY